jgi:hypothetical protein
MDPALNEEVIIQLKLCTEIADKLERAALKIPVYFLRQAVYAKAKDCSVLIARALEHHRGVK